MSEDNYTFRDCILLTLIRCSHNQVRRAGVPWLIHDAIGLGYSSQTFSVQRSRQTPCTYLNSWVFLPSKCVCSLLPSEAANPLQQGKPSLGSYHRILEWCRLEEILKITEAPLAGSSHCQVKGPRDTAEISSWQSTRCPP